MEHIEPDVRLFFCLPFTYSDVLIGHDAEVAGNTDEIVNGAENGSIDVGLITGDLIRPNPMIHLEEILVEDLVAIVPKANACQLPNMLRPRDLASLPLILFDPAGRTRDIINTWFKSDGIKPIAAMELGSIEAIKMLVGADTRMRSIDWEAMQYRQTIAFGCRPQRSSLGSRHG